MIYMQSASQNGSNSLSLNVYFQTGTNLQLVEADALNRINTAMPQLLTQVQAQGVTMRLQNPDLFIVTLFIQILASQINYLSVTMFNVMFIL